MEFVEVKSQAIKFKFPNGHLTQEGNNRITLNM